MKIKQIMYRSYSNLEPQEKRFYTLNSEKYELNTCNECQMIDSTYELFWDSDYFMPDTKDSSWNCLCECCYEEIEGKPL